MPGIEVFSNVASCVATGAAGTTTSDTSWTMGTGSGSFPAASSSAVPATYFYVADPADATHEIVQVINASGTAWTVVRGALGSTAVAHAALATWVQVYSHGSCQNSDQYTGAATSAVSVSATTTETLVASYTPLPSDIAAGAVFDLSVFGMILSSTTPTGLILTLRWNWVSSGSPGTSLLVLQTGTNGPAVPASMASPASFHIDGKVVWLSSSSLVAEMSLIASKNTATGSATSHGASTTAAVTGLSGSGPLALTAKYTATTAGNSINALAPLIHRVA